MGAPSKTDLMYEILYNWDFTPHPSPKVNVKTSTVDGKDKYFMKNHVAGTLYELDELSYYIWVLLDGKRNMAEILEEMEINRPEVQPITVLQTILFYAESGGLQSTPEPVDEKRVRVESAFKVHVVIVKNSVRFLQSIHRAIRPLLKGVLLWASLAFIVLIGLAFAGQFINILGEARNFEMLGSTVVGLFIFNFVILAPVTAIHEIAHGVAVVHYGGKPRDMGTGWFYFGPMFYCDATDAWAFSRRQRILVMLAGNLSTMLIGAIIVAALYVWPFPLSFAPILYMTAFWCFYTSLWNFAPPFETDGYYVLSDLLNMPNLRHDAYAYLKNTVKRLLKKPVEEVEGLSVGKKRILLGYAVLSVGWLAYMAYQSSRIMTYMAEDAAVSVLNISSTLLSTQVFSAGVVGVSIVSIVYFAMMVTGYLFIFGAAIKKATVRALPFEAIHDRDLSVFLYLPIKTPLSLAKKLQDKMAKEARKFTINFKVTRLGPMCTAVLRMGGKTMALAQIKEHLREIENAFNSMYQKFLKSHKTDILTSIGVYSSQKIELTNLLREMAKQTAKTGTPEAIAVAENIIQDQNKMMFYLLNSVSGKVWTIELPPAQKYEVQKSLLPILSVEDLSITDLYDEVEDFKKRVIYGFDSLAKLAIESQTSLTETLERPEEFQLVTLFEPVKGRLVFVGRTEQTEQNIAKFGSLFVDQAWCSYIDNLLSETNHFLSVLGKGTSLNEDEIQSMKDAELTVLRKNLTRIQANEDFVEDLQNACESYLHSATHNLEELRQNLEATSQKTALADAILSLNTENMKNLPRRFKDFKKNFQGLRVEVKKMKQLVEKEHRKRKAAFSKKKRRTTHTYPLFAFFSAIAVFLATQAGSTPVRIAFIAIAAFAQLVYWTTYLLIWRSFYRVDKYSSWTFNNVQIFLFALAQGLYKFIATGDILTPTETKTS